MAGETRGAGQEGGRDGVGDRGAAEGTLDHCRGRRGQVHGWPGMETLSDKVTDFPSHMTEPHTWNRHHMIRYTTAILFSITLVHSVWRMFLAQQRR